MTGCHTPGSRVWLLDSGKPARKYPFTWEIGESHPGMLVGVSTARANVLVREAIETGVIAELQGYERMRGEVAYSAEGSRIDLKREGARGTCIVEVKNVTAAQPGMALFPDAVSSRGTKHLRDLARVVAGGQALLCFCVQRADVAALRAADEIDPLHGETLRAVLKAGVEAIAYHAEVNPLAISLVHSIPVVV